MNDLFLLFVIFTLNSAEGRHSYFVIRTSNFFER